jgi:succinate dehydrogenase / fumarate reductase flavoprotein subunit
MQLECDVLVIGAGAAGIYAALEAAREGASVILVDRSLIGRSGATVMAQMTVAVALGEKTPDHWHHHLADTLAAGRGLCDERLSAMVCEDGPLRIREMDDWGVGWAREDSHIAQVQAPGHDRPRCVYVDVLSTGPAVSRTLRTQLNRVPEIRRIGDLVIVDLSVADGRAYGAVGVHVASGEVVTFDAKSVVIATGGLTRLYRRNSASANMGGDGYALALRAGAELVDMEFVQFFPIGHLAPRLVGMDPIMWDPFRYKIGGQLLNGNREPFEPRYAKPDERSDGTYKLTRDLATYAITKEVEAGRGTPSRGAYLSFRHVPEAELPRLWPCDRPPRRQRHRSDQTGCRGRADCALPHGRRAGVGNIGDQRRRSLCLRRGHRRRERRQPPFRQRDHRSLCLRRPRRKECREGGALKSFGHRTIAKGRSRCP